MSKIVGWVEGDVDMSETVAGGVSVDDDVSIAVARKRGRDRRAGREHILGVSVRRGLPVNRGADTKAKGIVDNGEG